MNIKITILSLALFTSNALFAAQAITDGVGTTSDSSSDSESDAYFSDGEGNESLDALYRRLGIHPECSLFDVYASFYNKDISEKEMYALIQAGASIQGWDRLGKIVLHYAAQHGHKKVMRLLVAKGQNVNAQDSLQATPLHYAAYFKESRAIKFLTQQDVIDVTIQDKHGDTALYAYVQRSFIFDEQNKRHYRPTAETVAIVHVLLKKSKEAVFIKNNKGHYPLDWVLQNIAETDGIPNSFESQVIEELFKADADFNVCNLSLDFKKNNITEIGQRLVEYNKKQLLAAAQVLIDDLKKLESIDNELSVAVSSEPVTPVKGTSSRLFLLAAASVPLCTIQ